MEEQPASVMSGGLTQDENGGATNTASTPIVNPFLASAEGGMSKSPFLSAMNSSNNNNAFSCPFPPAFPSADKQPIVPAFMSSSSSSNGDGLSKSKRNVRADNLDELLSAITAKMGSADLQDSKPELIAAFLEVMRCSDMEAEFYLESSNWDIANAISLCVDANPAVSEYNDVLSSGGKKSRGNMNDSYMYYGSSNAMSGVNTSSMSDEMFAHEGGNLPTRYGGRQIFIEGLDPAWTAHVSRKSGKIYFRHTESTYTQREVPPGFDDVDPQNLNSANPSVGTSLSSSAQAANGEEGMEMTSSDGAAVMIEGGSAPETDMPIGDASMNLIEGGGSAIDYPKWLG